MKDQYKIILFIIVLIFSLIFISSCNNANEPKEDYFYMCNYFSDKNFLTSNTLQEPTKAPTKISDG